MRRYLAIIVVLCGLLAGMSHRVDADGECTPNKQLKESFNEAVAAEKSGNLALAFSSYNFAKWGAGCEGPNLSSKEAQEGWKRVGYRLGKEAETKGNFYSEGSYTQGPNSNNPFRVVLKDAGAFQWYSQIGESEAADRVMSQYVRSRTKDIEAFRIGVVHYFQGFNGGVNNAEALRDLEKQARSNPGDKALKVKIGYLKELENIALRNIDEELVQEEKAFNKKEMPFEQKNKPVMESREHLIIARDWYNLFGDLRQNKAVERAEKRGDALSKDDKPQSLANARDYYGFAEDGEKARKVIEKANRLGDVHAKKGKRLVNRTPQNFMLVMMSRSAYCGNSAL
ncbi:MAG: hypothetical protein IT393_03635 [Nitrospirae bacterium]|nr:hypothetical protein [Nitrospirota bacterium]